MATYTYGGSLKLELDSQLDRALERTNGDPVAAANLFMRWAEQDSEVHALIPDVIRDYVIRRVKARAKKAGK